MGLGPERVECQGRDLDSRLGHFEHEKRVWRDEADRPDGAAELSGTVTLSADRAQQLAVHGVVAQVDPPRRCGGNHDRSIREPSKGEHPVEEFFAGIIAQPADVPGKHTVEGDHLGSFPEGAVLDDLDSGAVPASDPVEGDRAAVCWAAGGREQADQCGNDENGTRGHRTIRGKGDSGMVLPG